MTNSLLRPEAQNVVERLHTLADTRDEAVVRQVRADEAAWNAASSQQKAAMLQDALLACFGGMRGDSSMRSPARLLPNASWSSAPRSGISTIYFAAAVRDNGGGTVIGSELEASKVAKANQHLAEAGLSQFADIRPGDALETLRGTGF